MRYNKVINQHFANIFIEILSDLANITGIENTFFNYRLLLIWPSMDRLLSSRTQKFLTQTEKFRGKLTAPNAFTAEPHCLQV